MNDMPQGIDGLEGREPAEVRVTGFRPVVGWEAYYKVSVHGKVRSYVRLITRSDGACPYTRKGRPLRWITHTDGYPYVILALGDIRERWFIHRLVLLAFRGPPPEGMLARHLNGNRYDPRLKNLKWGTSLENAADRVAHGRAGGVRGERNHLAKLKEAQARDILSRKERGAAEGLALEFGVTQATIYRIWNGDTWSHIHGSPRREAV